GIGAARLAGGSRRVDARVTRRADGTLDYAPPEAFPESIGPGESWVTVPLEGALGDLELGSESTPASGASPFPLVIQPPPEPWADGLFWPVQLSGRGRHIVRLTCHIERGIVAFGVVTRQGRRVDDRVVVHS